jgi:hypothetical protein
MRRRPSKLNGIVATTSTRAPVLLAISAITGAAPDPAFVHVVWALLNHNDFVTLR